MVTDTTAPRTDRRVLVLSEVFDADTVRRRGIPTPNAAAWNRTFMLARLLEMRGYRVTVLSSGVTFRSDTGFAIHAGSTRAVGRSQLRTLVAVGPRYVARTVAIGLLAGAAVAHLWRERPEATIAYNYSFLYLLIGLCSLILGVRFVVDIEDITELAPERSPIGPENLKRRMLIRAMRWTLRIASAVIVPARSFASKLGPTRRFAVIDYSMTDRTDDRRFGADRVNVLFCGPYSDAHGFGLLVGALRHLRSRGLLHQFRFHLTGAVPDPQAVALAAGDAFGEAVVLHGFLPPGDYRALLAQTDVGLSLQLRSGPFGATNTPSKSFEFLAAGLLLVCTEVGDQADWHDRALLLRHEDAGSLARLLESIAADRARHETLRAAGTRAAARDWNALDKAIELEAVIAPA